MSKILSALVKSSAVVAVSVLFGGASAQQKAPYDNSTTYLGKSYFAPGNFIEFGDQVALEPNTLRTIPAFQFEYFLSSSSGNEFVELSIRDMNGSAGGNGVTPGTLLYNSGLTAISAGFHTFIADNLNITLTDNITWSVYFSGLDGTEKAGLLLYSPPTSGSSTDDFWQRDLTAAQSGGQPGPWTLQAIPDKANFGARVVPEPGTWALLTAGLAGLSLRRCRRKS